MSSSTTSERAREPKFSVVYYKTLISRLNHSTITIWRSTELQESRIYLANSQKQTTPKFFLNHLNTRKSSYHRTHFFPFVFSHEPQKLFQVLPALKFSPNNDSFLSISLSSDSSYLHIHYLQIADLPRPSPTSHFLTVQFLSTSSATFIRSVSNIPSKLSHIRTI